MSSSSGETAGPAVQMIMSISPPDDAGARTADLYDWQASMAAADGLALYRTAINDDGVLADSENCRVLCEYHEDWVAIRGDDAELVSAKHKEPSFGAYATISQLHGEGGLGHLFSRWLALKEAPYCRLVTTSGLKAGPAQNLEKATVVLKNQRQEQKSLSISGGPGEAVVMFAKELLKNPDGLSDSWKVNQKTRTSGPSTEQHDQVARFFSMLTLQHGSPSRAYINDAAPGRYAKPVLERLGYPSTPPEAVWEAVLGIFRSRMRAAGRGPRAGYLQSCRAFQERRRRSPLMRSVNSPPESSP